MRKLAETQIPTVAPKLPKGWGEEGRRHDGFSIDANALPEERDDLESAEVKEQDESQHCGPPAQKGFCLRNGSRHDPEQNRAEDRFDDRPQPTSWHCCRYRLTPIQESRGIASRPTQQRDYERASCSRH